MDPNSKVFKNLETLLKVVFAAIGPKPCLEVPDDQKYTFQDDIKFTELYFNSGYLFREMVLEQIKSCKGKTNYFFSYKIFDRINRDIYERIKKRNAEVQKTLNHYLVRDDFIFASNKLEDRLNNSIGKFRLILVTDLIELRDMDSFQIGTVAVKKIDENYLKDFPAEMDDSQWPFLGSITTDQKTSLNKEEFLKKHKEHVALEVDAEGYHFEKEMSPVFDLALREFRQTFAYLFMCKHFLENVQNNRYTVQVKKFKSPSLFGPTEPIGLQDYYLRERSNYSSLRMLDTRMARIRLCDKTFVLSKECSEQIKHRCCLEQFNVMMQSQDMGEIKDKINSSLEWFLKAILEADEIGQFINLLISLESLLSTEPDPLTAHTDDMAENIAIMLTPDADSRYKHKRKFKSKIYRLRNQVIHHGYKISSNEDWVNLRRLRNYVVWSLRGIIERLEKIIKYGKKSEAIREYFVREKLKTGLILPRSKTE